MWSVTGFSRRAAAVLMLGALAAIADRARADDGFPFGFELTLDVAQQPGSKRVPLLEIGDSGEATLDLWCKDARGPVFRRGQYRDLCSRSGRGSRLLADTGGSRRSTGHRLERGDQLETRRRFHFLHRNEIAAFPPQHQLDYRVFKRSFMACRLPASWRGFRISAPCRLWNAAGRPRLQSASAF